MDNVDARVMIALHRKEIEESDRVVIINLAYRMRQAQAVGEHKKDLRLPIENLTQEKKVIKRIRRVAGEAGMDMAFAEKLYKLIIKESKRIQK